ncbi:LOW QUALITY PROTEIN: serine/threonine-protein kinase LMTK3-like, partial [Aphelocoma coerulescens]|uniref:LOW QUALITY PROTEIN: serine/threonine-protein kinase LMTK3-like n=1 Tax=Aphelocoma coerulescens TaxID=39617 RepID=UPI0036044F24
MASLGPPGALGAPPARGECGRTDGRTDGGPDVRALSPIGYRLSGIGYLLSVIGYRLSGISYRLSVIGCAAPAGRGPPPPWAALLLSCSGLVAFVLLLLTCLCCKRGHLGFKEFENPEGDEDSGDFSPPPEDSSSSPSPPPEVFVVPLEPPGPPPAPPALRRQQLSFLQEIGTGWFGKVILGELRGGPGPAQVVVKELRAGAGTPERRRFLAEAEPYRSLRHPNLLRCLGGCRERPLLLVMEYCQMGDLKRYLRAQRGEGGGAAPPPLPPRDLGTLQRLALEVTRGLRHLHRHGFVHSDLALRNVLLTSELTVRLGDYGLGPANYREDYYVTPERALVPLRWVAPELVTKGPRGTLEVAPQSKESNVWALGVTLWELLEWGAQPLPHLSDRELLGRLRSRRPPGLPRPRLALPPPWAGGAAWPSSACGSAAGARGAGAGPELSPGVLPVLGARSPSGGSEYFIRLEEHEATAAAVTSAATSSSAAGDVIIGGGDVIIGGAKRPSRRPRALSPRRAPDAPAVPPVPRRCRGGDVALRLRPGERPAGPGGGGRRRRGRFVPQGRAGVAGRGGRRGRRGPWGRGRFCRRGRRRGDERGEGRSRVARGTAAAAAAAWGQGRTMRQEGASLGQER